MNNLLINRINFRFNKEIGFYLNISKPDGFALVGSTVIWTKGKLPTENLGDFEIWLKEQEIESGKDFISFDFSNEKKERSFSVRLNEKTIKPFKAKIFIQELGNFFIERGFYVEPRRMTIDFSAYQRIEDFGQDWELFKRIDFKWKVNRGELSFNIGSEKALISRQRQSPEKRARIVNEESQLVYTTFNDTPRRYFAGKEIDKGSPDKFSYIRRYNELKSFLSKHINEFRSDFFDLDRSGLNRVELSDLQTIFKRQNLMAFGGGKTSVNAALGMREYGPFKKIQNANMIKLLFVYKNRDDANNLYMYLRNGLKHFPGLLSYTGIPVSLPDKKGCKYNNVADLPNELDAFIKKEYPGQSYPETLAIVIGPFRKFESDEEESATYYNIKKLLLDKGISSQFISNSIINTHNFHYALPNIAIAILAKLGGIPWKLSNKRYNELIIGFNTKKYGDDTFLGSAVFFDNEGKLGKVQGFPKAGSREIVQHLKNAIVEYNKEFEEPDRLVIHYYKPPQEKELKKIELLLKEELKLPTPFAVVEVNDSKAKMDICFDAGYQMGMPESGTYVKVGWDEYLLFNNNRYQKKPARRIEEVLPIKIKISFADTGGFHHKELITQVYEFSRLYWKGLKQRSQPVTIIYSKLIADFSSNFLGEIPNNIVAQKKPWFI